MVDQGKSDGDISQFAEPICFEDNPATREAAMADTTAQKYRTLAERVRRDLAETIECGLGCPSRQRSPACRWYRRS